MLFVALVALVALVADVAGVAAGGGAFTIPLMRLPCPYMLAPLSGEKVDVVGAKEDDADFLVLLSRSKGVVEGSDLVLLLFYGCQTSLS